MSNTRQRLIYSAASAAISIIVCMVAGTTYVSTKIEENSTRITQQERENDLRFCDLLTASLSVPPPDSSPTTQYGKDRAAADAAVQLKIRELATRLECPNPPPPKDE